MDRGSHDPEGDHLWGVADEARNGRQVARLVQHHPLPHQQTNSARDRLSREPLLVHDAALAAAGHHGLRSHHAATSFGHYRKWFDSVDEALSRRWKRSRVNPEAANG